MARSATEHKKALRELLDRALDKVVELPSPHDFAIQFGLQLTQEEVDRGVTYAELMVRQLVQKACSGNDKSIGEILDRLVGKPVQTAEVTTRHYTYNDFLLSIEAQEQASGKPKKQETIDVKAEPEIDLLEDL